MKIIVETNDKIKITALPEEVSGSFWIVDNHSKNLINVIEENGNWLLKSNSEVKIVNDFTNVDIDYTNYIENIVLQENKVFFVINVITKDKYILYTLPGYEKFENYIIDYNKYNTILVGKNKDSDIVVDNNTRFFISSKI